MRQIKYIIINDTFCKVPSGAPARYDVTNLGHHYIVKRGEVLNPIDVCEFGSFMPKPTCGQENLNKCSIGIKFNGKLSDTILRAPLINLLVELRHRYPDAVILAKDEYDRHHTNVRDDMNLLRRELSDLKPTPWHDKFPQGRS